MEKEIKNQMEHEIYRNDREINAKIKRAESALPVVERLLEKFKVDGIEQSLQNIKKFYSSGPEYLKDILLKEAHRDIEKLKITNANMRRSLLNTAISIDEAGYELLKTEMHSTFGRIQIDVDDITIQENGPTLSDEWKESVQQQFTVNLSTPDELEFWETLKTFCDTYNSLESLAEKTGRDSLNEHLDPDSFSLLKLETLPGGYTKLSPNPDGMLNL